MSHSLSPTNRNSIFGWVKNLKRGSLMSNDSVNDVTSDNDVFPTESRSPTKSINNGQLLTQSPHSHQEFLRPILHHKSRSTNNLNRVRTNSFNLSEKGSSIRQHRDSFLQHNPLVDENSKYFGVSLEDAISQASAKISILMSEDSNHVLQYGRIPIVVAKCGVYLKKNGLNVEGIFRVGGSSKRVKEIQLIFNTPPDFGKKLSWDGYTVHDAASVLRRYLNALPEPLIVLDLYECFREPLRKRQRIIHYMKYKAENPNKPYKKSNTDRSLNNAGEKKAVLNPELLNANDSQPLTETNIGRLNNSNSSTQDSQDFPWDSNNASRDASRTPSQSNPHSQADIIPIANKSTNDTKAKAKKLKNYTKLTKDIHEAIDEYKEMVDKLPNLSKQLLFYILDLLALVQNNSTDNLMPSRNLAAIFQPSILSHPSHDLDPVEYALSQLVVEFLIQYAYILLPNQNQTKPGRSKSKQLSSSSIENASKSETQSKPQAPSQEQQEQLQEQRQRSRQPEGASSNLTSTNTTPLDFELRGPLDKPVFKRRHSKSLSSSSNHEDLVGYQNNVNSKCLPIVDSDHDFEISDDDNDEGTSVVDIKELTVNLDDFRLVNEEIQKLDGINSTPNVSIIVSTPPLVVPEN